MDKETARRLYWIKAIDEHDGEGRILSTQIRKLGAPRSESAGKESGEQAIARRVDRVYNGLSNSQPVLARLDQILRWPRSVAPAVILAAFAAGIFTDTLASGKHIHLIAFPLLGLLLWNLVIYLVLLFRTLLLSARKGGGSLLAIKVPRWWMCYVSRQLSEALPPDQDRDLWPQIARQFIADWLKSGRPLLEARVRIILHLASIAAIAGLVGGMYFRGLAFEYRAGWSSTFLDAQALHLWHQIILGPASAMTGIPLPDAAGLEQLRWRPGFEGENAGRWIHLFGVTAAWVVVAPRLLLALGGMVTMRRWLRSFPASRELDHVTRSLTRPPNDPSRRAFKVCIFPANCTATPEIRERLRRWFIAHGEPNPQFDLRDPVRFADLDAFFEAVDLASLKANAFAVLFNFATTPETEVQGEVVARLQERIGAETGTEKLFVVLDETAFAERFARQPERIGQRRTAWLKLLEGLGIEPLFLSPPAIARSKPDSVPPETTPK